MIDGAPECFGPRAGRQSAGRHDHRRHAARQPRDLLEDDYLEIITGLQMEPRMSVPAADSSASTVSHSSSTRCRRSISRRSSPSRCCRRCRRRCSWTRWKRRWPTRRHLFIRRVTGIKSPTGVEAEGWLISVGGTPKEIMATARSSPTAACWRPPTWPTSWARRSWAWAPSPRWWAMRG